ncbi:1-deoxy-D-xylulose-5-phosphate synthase [Brachyspira innocens]|uniref:1-deoxy-D-xylulose-5-phosphate synthase n=1 Tax=Brachyspira innocens TaxID=13264 RepID=A0ABT8Z045_9SPIR|nr:1-deoxy-D-xylulose-5-phosphate synthase [Brachyspira innocens]MDO6992553.1 1-deoxy-D-xylulose-5-phosphate synthase [Brachyspira innocens]MDO7020749.1 1-deoxy-D-xylulose-5-phosphate synthase [Brachyspira innocens]
MYLEGINSPIDLKRLTVEELQILSSEIREFLINNVSNTGGHLGSNLGVVDLTIVLHYLFSSPRDAFIFDVGHQSYTHKILTGRKDLFHTLRKYGGLSGFPKKSESEHDIEETGHASTSLSFAYGLACSRNILGIKGDVIAIIGDGAMTGGMALEAMNNIANTDTDIIIVLNNNEMSIGKNIGAISKFLNTTLNDSLVQEASEKVRGIVSTLPFGDIANEFIDRGKGAIRTFVAPGIAFREMGFKYFGPVDGYNYDDLINTFNKVKSIRGPRLVQVNTVKGKGYKIAEENPSKFHGIAPFDIETGELKTKQDSKTFSAIAGECIVNAAKSNKNIAAITAAMESGTGLTEYAKMFPDRFFDVGIAEQHAVTFAVGLAESGIIPFVCLYSTFLQRAYDQVIHDVGIMNANVKLMIDRAGLVPEDGDTHQGVFDVSFLRIVPNITIMAPICEKDFRSMVKKAVEYKGPVVIRYNKSSVRELKNDELLDDIEIGKAYILREDKINNNVIISYGQTLIDITEAAYELNTDFTIINLSTLKPLDEETILKQIKKANKVLIIEEALEAGGIGSAILELLSDNEIYKEVKLHALPDKFFESASRAELLNMYKLDKDGLKEVIKNYFL